VPCLVSGLNETATVLERGCREDWAYSENWAADRGHFGAERSVIVVLTRASLRDLVAKGGKEARSYWYCRHS
jgi:hypothetical protein